MAGSTDNELRRRFAYEALLERIGTVEDVTPAWTPKDIRVLRILRDVENPGHGRMPRLRYVWQVTYRGRLQGTTGRLRDAMDLVREMEG